MRPSCACISIDPCVDAVVSSAASIPGVGLGALWSAQFLCFGCKSLAVLYVVLCSLFMRCLRPEYSMCKVMRMVMCFVRVMRVHVQGQLGVNSSSLLFSGPVLVLSGVSSSTASTSFTCALMSVSGGLRC